MRDVYSSSLDHVKQLTDASLERVKASFLTGDPLIAEVTLGGQSGSVAFVDEEQFEIGGDLSDRLFLAGMPSDDAKIEVKTSTSFLGSYVTVNTERQDVLLDQTKLHGTSSLHKLPIEITCGADSLVLDRAGDSFPNYVRLLLLSIIGILFSALSIVGVYLISTIDTSRYELTEQSTPASSSQNTPASNSMAAATALLVERGFEDSIKAQVSVPGVVELNGMVAPSMAKTWAATRVELDSLLADHAIVNRVRIQPTISNVPAFKMVSETPTQFIELLDGVRVLPGERLVGEWVLKSIKDGVVFVEYAGETVSLKYREQP